MKLSIASEREELDFERGTACQIQYIGSQLERSGRRLGLSGDRCGGLYQGEQEERLRQRSRYGTIIYSGENQGNMKMEESFAI